MKIALKLSILSALLFSFLIPSICHAQIPSFRNEIRKAHSEIREETREVVREEMKEEGKEEGREALEEITYENDSRYPSPENRVQATIGMEMKSFKNNGKVKNTTRMKIVFGPTGECMIMNEGTKNETQMLFDYEGAATYMVNVEQKTAMKMPMINFQKMAEKLAENVDIEQSTGTWEKTNEHQTINGYDCRKYVYTAEEGTKMVMWFTKAISIDLSDNHLFGGQIKDYSFDDQPSTAQNLNAPSGLMVRSTIYEEGEDEPSTQTDITTFEKTYDPRYFDLTGYKIIDVLGKL